VSLQQKNSPSSLCAIWDNAGDNLDIHIWNLARENFSRLTLDKARDDYPVWTTDSKKIIFSSTREGATGSLYWFEELKEKVPVP
jgi:Tol biopolymer transport system component